jgi:hypothetical protein
VRFFNFVPNISGFGDNSGDIEKYHSKPNYTTAR